MQTATTTNQEIQHLMRFFFMPEPGDLCTYECVRVCVFLMLSAPERWCVQYTYIGCGMTWMKSSHIFKNHVTVWP